MARSLPKTSDAMRNEARVIREAAERAATEMELACETSREVKQTLNGLRWAVAESEVLRDPSLHPAAREILTKLVNLNL